MLWFFATLGGLLLMMGSQSRSESLFYYFRIEDQVPENHLLRLIDRPSRKMSLPPGLVSESIENSKGRRSDAKPKPGRRSGLLLNQGKTCT